MMFYAPPNPLQELIEDLIVEFHVRICNMEIITMAQMFEFNLVQRTENMLQITTLRKCGVTVCITGCIL